MVVLPDPVDPTRASDQGNLFSRLYLQAEVGDDLLPGHIGKIHVFEFDDSFPDRVVFVSVLVLTLLVKYSEDALRARKCRLDLPVELGKLVDRP